MDRKIIFSSLICLAGFAACLRAGDITDAALRIYLPREITIENNKPLLNQVAILRGNETLIQPAGHITMGRIAMADQNLVIDRDYILGRLACNGIDPDNVAFSGAEEVTVKRQHQSITSQQLVDEAADFLKKNLPNESICQFQAVRVPNSLVAPGSGQSLRLDSQVMGLSGNQCKVRTTVYCDEQKIAVPETVFLVQFKCRKAFATKEIKRNQPITTENINIRQVASRTPEPAGWMPPYGQVAKRDIAANTEISAYLLNTAESEALLKRNQTVTIMINRAGFTASATGQVLQEGAVGEFVKVKNVDSQKIIMAKILEDGTVEPVF